jgi:tetratricopeptide (TPR) repeat protein
MNNLALVLSDQGKYEQAEEIHRQILELRETILGEEHPDTLTSMNNLALGLSNQGEYEQAEEMHRQELELCETVLGKDHPSTLTSMSNPALVLSDQRKPRAWNIWTVGNVVGVGLAIVVAWIIARVE